MAQETVGPTKNRLSFLFVYF